MPNHDEPNHDERRLPPASVIEDLAERHAMAATPPRATYRLQFHAGFTLADAQKLVPYLDDLGVDALYASPHFMANPGSQHGYDVTDYNAFNPEVGTPEEHQRLTDALCDRGMTMLLDFVPNHMGVGKGANAWWGDVLENGRTSPYAEYFDIDWRPIKRELREKVLLPLLGDYYGEVLERGELRLRHEGGAFWIDYFETPLPVAPPSYPIILRPVLGRLAEALPEDDLVRLEMESITEGFDRLPQNDERDQERMRERRREQLIAKRRLAEIVDEQQAVREAVEAVVDEINGTPGDPESFNRLDALLEAQSYRLSYWRVAADEINYRRFFAINELAAIRQELPEVFAATHRLLLDLVGESRVTGVRVDHPDGLLDPAGYFRDLQRAAFLARCRADVEAGGSEGWAWDDLEAPLAAWWEERGRDRFPAGEAGPLYLLVEKILEAGEHLPADWPVHGTTGYDFARLTTGLFVDAANRKKFDELYERFTGSARRLDDLIYEAKKLIMRVALASEVNVLALALDRISEQRRTTRDFTLNSLRFALREIIACFPVYRTYIVCGEGVIHERDRRQIESAVAMAKRRNPASDTAVFDFARDVLLQRYAEDATAEEADAQCRFAMKFQQLTGPVMAKGVEDTAFYIDNRLASLNEVGGSPAHFGVSIDEFHRANGERARRWPHAMLASSTHDTKRSEDVRARIDVLSELPREWRGAVNRWARLNRRHKTKVDGVLAPDRNDEYLLYQTLLGAWPFGVERPDEAFTERIVEYMLKALHEAQVHTSWVNPNEAYDAAMAGFVRGVLGAEGGPFLDDLAALRARVEVAGAVNGLAQHLLKLTAPGVPDIYQGTELWDFSLVDPDNRRPVDFDERRRLLRALKRRKATPALAGELLGAYQDGRIKLYLTMRALEIRRALPDVFRHGGYQPLAVHGKRQDHVVAFARRHEGSEVIVVVPRLVARLVGSDLAMPAGQDVWGDTRIALEGDRATYRDCLTGAEIEAGDGLRVSDVLATLPIALLERGGRAGGR